MNLITTLTILQLLFIKHWYIDFYNQTAEEVYRKGIYGDIIGFKHSLKHGIATIIALAYFDIKTALIIGLVDVVVHYHVDWTKSNINNYPMGDKLFWTYLGLDQLVHYTCYLCYMLYIAQALQ